MFAPVVENGFVAAPHVVIYELLPQYFADRRVFSIVGHQAYSLVEGLERLLRLAVFQLHAALKRLLSAPEVGTGGLAIVRIGDAARLDGSVRRVLRASKCERKAQRSGGQEHA